MKEEKNYSHVILWDWDGPLNDPFLKFDDSYVYEYPDFPQRNEGVDCPYDIVISNPALTGLTLRILEKHNTHSVLGSQRLTYTENTLEHEQYTAPILTTLNGCFGENRHYLTQEEAKIIPEGVDPDSTGASKNPFLANIGNIEGAKNVSNKNRILIDDSKRYRNVAVQSGYSFIWMSPKQGRDPFFYNQHLAQVLLTVTNNDLDKTIELIREDNQSDEPTKEKLIGFVKSEILFQQALKDQKDNFLSILASLRNSALGNESITNLINNPAGNDSIEIKINNLYQLIETGNTVHAEEVVEILNDIQAIRKKLAKENPDNSYGEIDNTLNKISEDFSKVSSVFNRYIKSQEEIQVETLRSYIKTLINFEKKYDQKELDLEQGESLENFKEFSNENIENLPSFFEESDTKTLLEKLNEWNALLIKMVIDERVRENPGKEREALSRQAIGADELEVVFEKVIKASNFSEDEYREIISVFQNRIDESKFVGACIKRLEHPEPVVRLENNQLIQLPDNRTDEEKREHLIFQKHIENFMRFYTQVKDNFDAIKKKQLDDQSNYLVGDLESSRCLETWKKLMIDKEKVDSQRLKEAMTIFADVFKMIGTRSCNSEDKRLLNNILFQTNRLLQTDLKSESYNEFINEYNQLISKVNEKAEKSPISGFWKQLGGSLLMFLGALILIAAIVFAVLTLPAAIASAATIASIAIPAVPVITATSVSTGILGGLAAYKGGFFAKKGEEESEKAKNWKDISKSGEDFSESSNNEHQFEMGRR